MKRAIKYCRHVFCTLALIVCFAQPVSAADETNYFDCTVFLYGFDSAVENIIFIDIEASYREQD